MFKYTIPRILPLLYPSLIWNVKTQDKVVYLTFDDGPHPEITPWVLEKLEQYQAKATFFCVGENVKKFTSVYTQIVRSGHATGNHTFNHLNGWKTSNDEYFRNISLCSEYITSKLFRPPFGRITPSQISKLKLNYRLVMWSILSRDYHHKLNVQESIQTLKNHIACGSVIVFHDSEKSEKNLKQILPDILEFLQCEGYKMENL